MLQKCLRVVVRNSPAWVNLPTQCTLVLKREYWLVLRRDNFGSTPCRLGQQLCGQKSALRGECAMNLGRCSAMLLQSSAQPIGRRRPPDCSWQLVLAKGRPIGVVRRMHPTSSLQQSEPRIEDAQGKQEPPATVRLLSPQATSQEAPPPALPASARNRQ